MAFHSGAQRCAENVSGRPGWPTRCLPAAKGLDRTESPSPGWPGEPSSYLQQRYHSFYQNSCLCQELARFPSLRLSGSTNRLQFPAQPLSPADPGGPQVAGPKGLAPRWLLVHLVPTPRMKFLIWFRPLQDTTYLAPAARRVLASSMARVMGPTPPGTGVMYDALSTTASKSTSPTIFPFSSRLMPTSMTTAPCFT